MGEYIFKYEEYSTWSRMLAKKYSVAELKKEMGIANSKVEMYKKQHLKAVEKTTSMQSNSQRRAQSGNNLRGNYEKRMAYSNAIELHKYYPDKCKVQII